MPTNIEFIANSQSSTRATMMTISIVFAAYIAVNYGLAIDLFSMVVSDMKNEIGFNYTAVGTISAMTRGGFLGASLLSMFIIPVIGAGRLIFLSVVGCTICFWGMSLANNVWVIGGIMTLMGAFAAKVYIPMVEVVGRLIQKKYHGRVTGFICGGQSLGVIGASLMVPYSVTHYTWRWAWMAVGGIGLLVLALSFHKIKRFGVFDIDRSDTRTESPTVGSPPGQFQSIRNLGTGLVLAIYFLSALSYNPFQTYLSPYFRDELGFSVDMAATIWSCIALPGIISGLVMGYVADRLSIRFSLILAFAATLIATMILLYFPTTGFLVGAGLLFGLAFYSIFGLIPAYISKVNSPSMGVTVFALANITHGAGGITGNFLGGWLKEITGTFQWLYGSIIIILLFLILLALFLPNENESRKE